MTQKNKTFVLLASMGLLVSVGLFFQSRYNQKVSKKIIDNLQIWKVFIREVSTYTYRPPGHSIRFDVLDSAHKKQFSSVSIYDYDLLKKDSIMHLKGRYLLVAVDSTQPEKYHHLLLTEEDFKTYGISIPDSLKYLKTYER